MEILLAIAFLLVCGLIIFVISFWWVFPMVAVVMGIGYLIVFAIKRKELQKVVSARIVSEEPIIKRVSEKTGHTTSYGRYLSYHEHYRDRDVVTGYNVKFDVEYESGRRGTITCKEGDYTYNKLIAKI